MRYPTIVAGLLAAHAAAQQQYPWATAISRTGWTASTDSSQSGNAPSSILDGNSSTFWHTEYSPSLTPLPHYIQVDMGKEYVVNGLSYQPRQDGNGNGNIGRHNISLSSDGTNWSESVYGDFLNDNSIKTTFFSHAVARYVRLTALSEAQSEANQWSSMAELNVFSPDPSMDASTFSPPNPTTKGRWDVTVDLPIVPVAGAVSHQGHVVFWAAYRPDTFGGSYGVTETATWDPETQEVSERQVSNTNHDMFCPGISTDAEGRVIVTGGDNAEKTSGFDADGTDWISLADMQIARGYQSSATLGDGRIFTIGGSWSGKSFLKPGEIYDPTADTWTNLTGCDSEPLLTNDAQGIFRSDNHAWLFGWKENSVFQAGPSSAMNWYNVSSGGSWTAAGNRAQDPDSMCGTATMYDATRGLILSAGGSPDYQDSDATSNAHIIQLGSPDENPQVTKVESMSYRRSFSNAAVLPDGKVLVMGGQEYAVPFTDDTPALPAELFDPDTQTWTEVAPAAVARTYHSIGLLLPDGRVLSGGGGLCGQGCAQNHFDFQVYSPPYLFSANGNLATRPTIEAASPAQLKPGAELTVQTDGEVASFSMVRYGTSTHTVNTDQRRVPLEAVQGQGNTYTMTIPEDSGVMLPGYWMLFAMDAAGVPSVSTPIKVLLA